MTAHVQGSKIAAGALLFMQGDPAQWLDCVRSILAAEGLCTVFIAGSDPTSCRRLYADLQRVHVYESWTLGDAIEKAEAVSPEVDVLAVITQPVSVAPSFLLRAMDYMEQDSRIATVSFLSNSAGYLSFPFRNTSVPYGISGLDETGVTARLRAVEPVAGLVPISMPSGSCVLLNLSPYRLCGGIDHGWDSSAKLSLAQFALKASRRGFSHALEASTYIMVPWVDGEPPYEAVDDHSARHRLYSAFREFSALYDRERDSIASPLAIALDVARAKVQGLRLLIDGSCLGAMEMGTQVQTVSLVDSLARREDVANVIVGVPNGVVPGYAAKLLRNGKIKFCDASGLHFEGADNVDIVHRPFQPDAPIPWERWRQLGKRVVITIQDLIAYKIGSYHRDGDSWLRYRDSMAIAAANADGVVAISDDTLSVIKSERLSLGDDRACVAKNGSDHLDLNEAESIPAAVLEAGITSRRYLLVLGANYTHKNRDLAIRVWRQLLDKGHDLALILAGAQVPMGSSRLEEAALRLQGGGDLVSMPDVSSHERNWLMRHAALVLYPTSSEGFGLVPFEAASMGVPTVHVSFGPLKELIDDDSIPKDWSVDALGDYAHSILTDPDKASKVVSTILRNARSLTWDETAATLVEFYRSTLSKVPR